MAVSSLDMFADEDLFGDVGVDESPKTPTPPAVTEGAKALMEISDDDVCAVDHVQHTAIPVAVPPTSCNKRQKVSTNSSPPLLQILPGESSMSLTCVFIPVAVGKKKKFVAVALWPQYEVSMVGHSATPSRWVVVGNYEDWILQLTQQLATGSRRCNAQCFKNLFNPIFHASVAKARSLMVKLKVQDDTDSDAEADDGPVNGNTFLLASMPPSDHGWFPSDLLK